MRKQTLALAAILVSTSALAAAPPPVAKPDPHEPIPGKADPRIRTFPFDPAMTMKLTSPGLVPVRVIFAEGSTVDTVAGALVSVDPKTAQDWLATRAGNTMLVQPSHIDTLPSMLFATVLHDGKQDNYVIELRVGTTGDLGNPTDPTAYAQVSYTYPQIVAAAAVEARAKAQRVQTESKIRTSLTQARFNAPRQWRYSKMGADCATMTPSGWNWLSDDGAQTTLLFAPHMDGAAVFSRESDSTKPEDESLITPIPTTTAVGTLEVLPGIYKQIVLRRGDKVCALRNDRYDPIGTQPGGGSGTISADVIRIRASK